MTVPAARPWDDNHFVGACHQRDRDFPGGDRVDWPRPAGTGPVPAIATRWSSLASWAACRAWHPAPQSVLSSPAPASTAYGPVGRFLVRQPTEVEKRGHPQPESRSPWSCQLAFSYPDQLEPPRGEQIRFLQPAAPLRGKPQRARRSFDNYPRRRTIWRQGVEVLSVTISRAHLAGPCSPLPYPP